MMGGRTATTRLALVGAAGRMGCRLDALATASEDLEVAARVDLGGPGLDAHDVMSVDVVIDFSVRAQAAATAAWCGEHAVPLVLGTTGLEPGDQRSIDAAAERAAIVQAPNFSVGVNVLLVLAAELGRMLDTEAFDLEVVEAHHRHKIDSPSGTARRIARVLAAARGLDPGDVAEHRPEGIIGPRERGPIGMSVVRGGDVVGEHTVYALGQGEQVILGHRATDRDIFVRGALHAARWVIGRGPGLYGMSEVLGADVPSA